MAALSIPAMLFGSLIYDITGHGDSGKIEAMAIGTPRLESSALIYIAERQGFFSRHGIAVRVRDYETGAASLNGLSAGEVDFAVSAEYALVGKAFLKEDLRAIASIGKGRYFYLVGRRDMGIENVENLKGKRIGFVRKTIAEFYLRRFLELNGIKANEVDIVDLDHSRSASAIAAGEVDAILCRPPSFHDIVKTLGSKAVVWPAQSSQALYSVLVGRNEWLTQHDRAGEKLMHSLADAEKFLIENPAESRAIIKERLTFDDDYLATVWSKNEFSLAFDQALILAMEDEARWMIKNGLTSEKVIPDFAGFLSVEDMQAVKPQAVSLIR